MSIFSKILAFVVMAFVITACNESKVQSVAVATCNSLAKIYRYYDNVASSGVIPVRYMNNVAAVRVETDKVCASPSTVTSFDLARIAGEAYLALNAAFSHGMAQGDAETESSASRGLDMLEDLKLNLQRLKKGN